MAAVSVIENLHWQRNYPWAAGFILRWRTGDTDVPVSQECIEVIQRKRISRCLLVLLLSGCVLGYAEENPPARIGWYGDLQKGLAEAKRSGRPILLISAAPHCVGVPGMW